MGRGEEYDKLITFINRKASKVSPSKFEDWVQSQSGEQNFTSFVNLTTLPRRRRSFLSNVYYSSESNRDQNTPSITPTTEVDDIYRQQQSKQIPVSNQSCINEYLCDQYTETIQKEQMVLSQPQQEVVRLPERYPQSIERKTAETSGGDFKHVVSVQQSHPVTKPNTGVFW
ncbi:hypothetical protein MFLAVUS_002963 [Mucor flavus]|uniref:Uncharacterized protein n=1 Tax=Mucor flavus TaxID=439312 RepID=A0ABP9YRT1_9FUNG